MPQSLAKVAVHIIYSTKNREPWLEDPGVRSELDQVRRYVANQEEHHKKTTFQDEFREICRRHGVQIDERYVWD